MSFTSTSSKARQMRDTEVKFPKPAHEIVALFDASVVLLQSIVEICVGPLQDISSKRLADRTRVGVMSIGRDSFGYITDSVDSLLEKALAASIFRFSLSIESTRLPSRSMARYK